VGHSHAQAPVLVTVMTRDGRVRTEEGDAMARLWPSLAAQAVCVQLSPKANIARSVCMEYALEDTPAGHHTVSGQ